MFNVRLYKFKKLDASTERPTDGGTLFNCELKGGCSVISPSLVFNMAGIAFPFEYNYAYIEPWKRYYYVYNWSWSNGVWVASCGEDTLASFKDEIGNLNVYIARASFNANGSVAYDGNIVDSTYPTTAERATYYANSRLNPLHSFYNPQTGEYEYSSGTFVIGMLSDRAINGAVTYYCMTPYDFRNFLAEMFGQLNWLSITDISENLQKALINPFQYMVSCQWLPFTPSDFAYTTSTIRFGWWDIAGRAMEVPAGVHETFVTSVVIPKHPEALDRGAYLNLSPYSIYTLKYYPFGTINIDSEAICNWNTLDLTVDVDIASGTGMLNISVNGKENPIRTIEAQIGVPIPTSQIAINARSLSTSGAVTGAVAGVASAVSELGKKGFGAMLKDAVKNLFSTGDATEAKEVVASAKDTLKEASSNIVSSALSANATVEMSGSQGNISSYTTQNLSLSGRFLPLLTEDLTHKGRPLYQHRTINTLKGFIMVEEKDIKIEGATAGELASITGYLVGGFFFE